MKKYYIFNKSTCISYVRIIIRLSWLYMYLPDECAQSAAGMFCPTIITKTVKTYIIGMLNGTEYMS